MAADAAPPVAELFPDRPVSAHTTGLLPRQRLRHYARTGAIQADKPLEDSQFQPASLDLRLGRTAWRLRASFLPGAGARVQDKLADIALHEIDLTKGAVLETGCVYLVRLMERMAFPARDRMTALANPKSSIGRLDVFTRLIADKASGFDVVDGKDGYDGPLYLEISPRTFPILVRMGSRLAQVRIRAGNPPSSDEELRRLHEEHELVSEVPIIDGGLALRIGLGRDEDGIVGWRAKRHAGLIDIDETNACDPALFWDPVRARPDGTLVLDPHEFYILASREAVHVPPSHAAQMMPYSPLVGEFRVHYAGFFDPGFGHDPAGGAGSRAVLEVRNHEVPFILEDGQIIGRLIYERLIEPPDQLYGLKIGSTYQRQGLKLSKHFRTP